MYNGSSGLGIVGMDWDWKEFARSPAELELLAGGIREEQVNDRASMGFKFEEDTAVRENRSMVDRVNDSKTSIIVSSPTRSKKRTRVQDGSQSIRCLVDGCSSDLGNCRDYHRRHRVCEQHSKASTVVVGGKQQRFCQQCSRFHALGEFDEVKRSCRKRLDGHNRRRRKPQPSSLFMSGERFLPMYKGPRTMQFNNTQIHTAPTVGSLWPAFANNEPKSKRNDHQQLWYAIDQQDPASYLSNKNRGRGTQFSLVQKNDTGAAPGASVSVNMPLPRSVVPGSGEGNICHPDETTPSIDSSCALYLLSSNSASTSELNLIKRSAIGPPVQSRNRELHFEAADNIYPHLE